MATISGTAGNDVITGTTTDDAIDGGAGNDRINGGAGNDVVYGGLGTDTLTGDAGNDTLYGGDGNDGFFGGGNDDAIYGENGDDVMYGDAGNDVMQGGAGNDTLIGGTGNDILSGGAGVNTINGGAGLDTVVLELAASDLTTAMRADLATLKDFMDSQLAAAGSTAALSTQTAGAALQLSALGVTLSNIEAVKVLVDGVETPITSLINRTPVADAVVSIATNEDQALSGVIAATDPDGDALAFTVATGPVHGALVMDAMTGAYTYTPNADYSGNDAFTVQVADGSGAVATQNVAVAVRAVADAPNLSTVDQTIAVSGGRLMGTNTGETLVAAAGISHILGGAGNDTIVAGRGLFVTAPLGIAAALQDRDGSETLSINITGMSPGSSLSAGIANADGSWSLSSADLVGLQITASTLTDLALHVTATSTEAAGASSSISQNLTITFDHAAAPSIIEGGSGSDMIMGGGADDTIYGGSLFKSKISLPSISSEKDNDVLHGGDGNDRMYGQKGNDTLYGEGGNDYLSGGKGDDQLYGGTGQNTIKGDSGNDVIFAQGGDDTISGGTGFDTLDFSLSNRGIAIDVSKGTALGFNTASFTSIEKIVGSSFADDFKGSSGADSFVGGAGADVVRGLGGADMLSGGAGNDTFVYMQKDAGGVDHITDFAMGDRLDLHDFLKSAKYSSIDDVVRVKDGAAGSTVSVKTSTGFVDLVVLDGVHGTSGNDLLSHGMILA